MRLVVVLACLLSLALGQEESEYESHHLPVQTHWLPAHPHTENAEHPHILTSDHSGDQHPEQTLPHKTGRKQLTDMGHEHEAAMEHKPSYPEHQSEYQQEHISSQEVANHAEHEHKPAVEKQHENPTHVEHPSQNEHQRQTNAQDEHKTAEVEHEHIHSSQNEVKHNSPVETEHRQVNHHGEHKPTVGMEHEHNNIHMEHNSPVETEPRQVNHHDEYRPAVGMEHEHTIHMEQKVASTLENEHKQAAEHEPTTSHETEHKPTGMHQNVVTKPEHEHITHEEHKQPHEEHKTAEPHEHKSPTLVENHSPTTEQPVLSFVQHHNAEVKLPNPFYFPKRLSDDVAREFCGEYWHFVSGNPCMVRCDSSRWADFVRMGNQVRCRIPWDNKNFGVCHNGFCW